MYKRVKQQIMHTINLYIRQTLLGEKGWSLKGRSLLVVKGLGVVVVVI